MFIKSLQIGLMGFLLVLRTLGLGPASIQGIVKDAQGKPIKSADVRVESEMASKSSIRSKTDAKGRYISQGLKPGVYRVSLVVNGAVKAAIRNTKAKADQATQLNFDLKPATAQRRQAHRKEGKHKVWVPSSTGSHIGGRWVEVPTIAAPDAGALNVKRASAEATAA